MKKSNRKVRYKFNCSARCISTTFFIRYQIMLIFIKIIAGKDETAKRNLGITWDYN